MEEKQVILLKQSASGDMRVASLHPMSEAEAGEAAEDIKRVEASQGVRPSKFFTQALDPTEIAGGA